MKRPGLLAESDFLKPTIDHLLSRLPGGQQIKTSADKPEAPTEEEPSTVMKFAGIGIALGIIYFASLFTAH